MTLKEKYQCELALKDYKSVKFFPFGNEAAAPFILTSDPLGYLEAWLDNRFTSIQRDTKKWKNKYTKAKYFTQLSKDFYNSSQTAKMPSKGTLLYYSFINLVKVYLILNGYDLETRMEHHGISLPSEFKDKLRLANTGGEGISIFHEFANCLGKPINNGGNNELKFVDLLRSLPEVHEIGYALNLFGDTKRKFLPVEISIKTTPNKKKLFYTISYEKKFDKQMKTDRLRKGTFKNKLQKIEDIDDSKLTHYCSIFEVNYTYNSEKSWKMCYPKLLSDIGELNIVPMITRQGYRYYLDLEPTRLHRLSSVLGFAYYLGTVARYRPSINEEILKGKFQSIINEAIISCPNQFFYLMVSHITKQICAIPMSKIE